MGRCMKKVESHCTKTMHVAERCAGRYKDPKKYSRSTNFFQLRPQHKLKVPERPGLAKVCSWQSGEEPEGVDRPPTTSKVTLFIMILYNLKTKSE